MASFDYTKPHREQQRGWEKHWVSTALWFSGSTGTHPCFQVWGTQAGTGRKKRGNSYMSWQPEPPQPKGHPFQIHTGRSSAGGSTWRAQRVHPELPQQCVRLSKALLRLGSELRGSTVPGRVLACSVSMSDVQGLSRCVTLNWCGCTQVTACLISVQVGHLGRETNYCRAAPNAFIPQSVVTHTQDLALGLVEPRGVPMGPSLSSPIPLEGSPSLRCGSHSTQPGAMYRHRLTTKGDMCCADPLCLIQQHSWVCGWDVNCSHATSIVWQVWQCP